MDTLLDSTDPQSPDVDKNNVDVRIRHISQRALIDSLYAVSAFPIALAGFILSVVVLALGLGLSVVVLGVPLLAVAVGIARSFAGLERRRLRSMLGRNAPAPAYLQVEQSDGFWRRTVTPLVDPRSWRDVAWTLVGAVSATAAAALTLTWWAVAGGGLTYWTWQAFIPAETDTLTLASAIGLGQGRLQESIVNFLIGALALATLPLAVRFAATIHATLSTALLVSVPVGTPEGETS
jgi:Putative sensor